jgi:hypothetical protein
MNKTIVVLEIKPTFCIKKKTQIISWVDSVENNLKKITFIQL